MLLIDHDQAEPGKGEEERGAGADHHADAALRHAEPGLAPLALAERGVPEGGRGAEAAGEAPQHLPGKRDFGEQHQHLPALGAGGGDRLEIDFRLA